jgi:hypothetical protein
MRCPLCHRRAARRGCPAVGREICAVCCGTKRLLEIACPSSCGYLAAAEAHPAAAVRRQHERDAALVGLVVEGLTQAQQQIAWVVLGFVARLAADPLLRLADEDVADMAASLAATLETAARGVIYEHRPRSVLAQRLSTDVKTFLEQGREQAGRGFDRDTAAALARIAETFRAGGALLGETGPTACLIAVGRLMRQAETAGRTDEPQPRVEPPRPSLIIP